MAIIHWQIDVGPALGIINGAAGEVEAYVEPFSALETALLDTDVALTDSGRVREAVYDLATRALDPHRDRVAGHSVSAVRGTTLAVRAYQGGHEQMASDAQRNAAAAVYPRDIPGQPYGSPGRRERAGGSQ